MNTIINLLLSGLAVALAAWLIPAVVVTDYRAAIVTAVVIVLLNLTLGSLLKLLTFPLNFLTLGLIYFIINVLMILLADRLIDGFSTGGFWPAALFAVILALVKMLIHGLVKKSH